MSRPLTHDEQLAVMARCLMHPDHAPEPKGYQMKLSIEAEAQIAARHVDDAARDLHALPDIPGVENYVAGRQERFNETMEKMAEVINRWRAEAAPKAREAA